MQEIRVTFADSQSDASDSGGEKRYLVRLTDSAGLPVGVEVPFTPFLGDDDYESLRWYLEDYLDLPDGGAVVRAEAVEHQLESWGRRLHDALFAPPENAACLRILLDASEPRELTIATRDAALLRLPWELMADGVGSLAQRLAVRRQLEVPERLVPREIELPVRMLYIVSRPSDTGFIDPRLTSKALLAALDPLGASVEIDFCRPPTLARMDEMLRDAEQQGNPYDVVHFDGHGTFLPEAQIGALCFEKADDGTGSSQTDFVRADRLGDLLRERRVPLVVLEACRSATIGKTAVFRSIAPRLIQAGVGGVLSMGYAVHVEAARILLDRFYRELVSGTTIGHAVSQARGALRAKQARWIELGPRGRTIQLQDWFLPHLYQRGLDEPLLPRNAAARETVRQHDVFLSHNHADSDRVEALARALSDKHGLRVWLDKWKCGPGALKPQCARGIGDSRFTVVVGSKAALASNWVAWEIAQHRAHSPEGDRLIPIKLEELALPTNLEDLLWVDFTDPGRDTESAARLAQLVRFTDADDARRLRKFRAPPSRGEPGAFPRPPQYGFQGRAHELHELERRLRRERGFVLHAMGGMGKTALATEAADWWTRSGLFRDGACFVSFEQFTNAERVVQVLGAYCEGPRFDQLPASEQRRRAVELFHERELLLVWDNYESVLPQFNAGAGPGGSPYTDEERRRLGDLFHDLTSGDGKGRLLVTCRPGDTGLPGAHRKEIQGLARADSLWLLHRILERDGLSLDDARLTREALDPLLDDLADHPLSLELVGPHLRTLRPEAIRADFAKLLHKFKQEAPEERNTSLLASLEFSRRHLTPASRDALPWLGLFSGGVFEDNFLDVSQIAPDAWEPIRTELQCIALIKVEDEIQIGNRPFLRFHPTLAIASADSSLSGNLEIRKRFIAVYVALGQMLDKALRIAQSPSALLVLDREETNYRAAVRWAAAHGENGAAATLGSTFLTYLRRSNRIRERDAWVEWLRGAFIQSGFTAEAAAYEQQHAWTLFTQGDPRGAVDKLQDLIDRLRHTEEFDARFHMAQAVGTLGRTLDACGSSSQAIPIQREAVDLWMALVEEAGGHSWEALLTMGDHSGATIQLGNLAAAMGDLGAALLHTGHHDEALAMSEDGLRIQEALGSQREVAAALGQCAQILVATGRYDEAAARHVRALAAAHQVGDKELQGSLIQHQGTLAVHRNQLALAGRLYQEAIRLFQEANDLPSLMRTYNSLGVVEARSGRPAEARAWHEKSHELAMQLNDQLCLGATAQNIGLLWQMEGEAARERGDEPVARQYFSEARVSVQEALDVWRAQQNAPNTGVSLSQLALVDLALGELDAADRHANEAREIRESLSLREVFRDYNTLAEIAQARGDVADASEWAKKRDDLLADLRRRAGGGDALPSQMLKALEALAIACAQSGFSSDVLRPDAEEALATLGRSPVPFPEFAAFLRQLAAGQLPPVPVSLPPELRNLLEPLAQAIRASQRG